MCYIYNVHMYICKYIVFKWGTFAHPPLKVFRGLTTIEAAKQGENKVPCPMVRADEPLGLGP